MTQRSVVCSFLSNGTFISTRRFSSSSIVVSEAKKSWVRKRGEVMPVPPGYMPEPVAYSERRMKRHYTYPDSPINDIFVNFFIGRCVYDHCFPYHIQTPQQFKKFMATLNAVKESVDSKLCGHDYDEKQFIDVFRQNGLLGIKCKEECGGLDVFLDKQFLRFCELFLDYTKNPRILSHVITQNVIQICIGSFIRNGEVSQNIQTLLNTNSSIEFLRCDNGSIKPMNECWNVTADFSLGINTQFEFVENPSLFLCIVKDLSSQSYKGFVVPTSDKNGLSWDRSLNKVCLKNCEVSAELTFEDGIECLEMYSTYQSICRGAVLSYWSKMLANDSFIAQSRRRRFGYRLNRFQSTMLQMEEIESLCYTIETLPYYTASRRDRAKERFNQSPPRMTSEVSSAQINLHRCCTKLITKLIDLQGPEMIQGNTSFDNYCTFVQLHADMADFSKQHGDLIRNGLAVLRDSFVNKEFKRPFTLRFTQFWFNNVMTTAMNSVEACLSDPDVLFVHHNFATIANDVDRTVNKISAVLRDNSSILTQTNVGSEKDNVVDHLLLVHVLKEMSLNLHLMMALLARSSRSAFNGNRFYHHELRIVEKLADNLRKSNVDLLLQFDLPYAFGNSIKIADSVKNEKSTQVFEWTKYPKSIV